MIVIPSIVLAAKPSLDFADKAASIGSFVLGSITLVATLWQSRRPARIDLDTYSADLRNTVRRQWRAEELLRRLQDPMPIRVSWRIVSAALGVQDHWANVTMGSASRSAARLSGTIEDLVAAFRLLPSQRLVIVGRPGAGKTVLAIRLLLDLVAHGRPGDPVPVLLPIASWNPQVTSLRRWLAAQLAIEHPGLGTDAGNRRTVANALVEDARILPVLDGLDEMPSHLRAVAIRTLNASLHIGDPLVLTCRTREYVAAVAAADGITAAGVVEIQPLALDDIAAYLPRTAHPGHRSTTKWEGIIARLRDQPDDPRSRVVLAALQTPLMIGLAREAYSETSADPGELLNDARFGRVNHIRDHLLDRSIPVAYQESVPSAASVWEPNRSQGWLINVATWLSADHRDSLAWWRFADMVPATVLATTGAFVGGTALLLASWSAGDAVIVATLAIAGAILGAVINLYQPSVPSSLRLSLAGGAARLRLSVVGIHRGDLRPASVGWVAWTVGGGVVAITVGLHTGWGSALIGLAAIGLVRVLDAWFEAPAAVAEVPSPEALLRTDRNTALSRATIRAAIIGGTATLLSSLAIGIGFALAALIVSVGYTAWGRFTLVRFWYALIGQLPWRLMAFLRDARARGILRQVGAVYQFRHLQLQNRLARTDRTDPADSSR